MSKWCMANTVAPHNGCKNKVGHGKRSEKRSADQMALTWRAGGVSRTYLAAAHRYTTQRARAH